VEDGERVKPEVWDCGEDGQFGVGVEGESSAGGVADDDDRGVGEEGTASAAAEEEGVGGCGGTAACAVGE